jgi:hypothetical protein
LGVQPQEPALEELEEDEPLAFEALPVELKTESCCVRFPLAHLGHAILVHLDITSCS